MVAVAMFRSRMLVAAFASLCAFAVAVPAVLAQKTDLPLSAEGDASRRLPTEALIPPAARDSSASGSTSAQDREPAPPPPRQPYDPAKIPFISGPPPQDLVDLAARPAPWAVAFTPDGRYFYKWGTTDADPSNQTLEACEFLYGQACIIYAASGWVTEKSGTEWTARPQATLRQTGQRLDVNRIPFVSAADRERLRSQIDNVGPSLHHVVALSAGGAWWFMSGERVDVLQRNALAQCNQARTNKTFPCFVFQVDGTVVMKPGGIDAQIR